MTADEFGLEESILGVHPDEFYGAVGRVVCVAAVLEDKITTLRHALVHADQGQYTHQPIGEQIKQARSASARCDTAVRDRIGAFLSAAEELFERRHGLVHSQFPAQADGTLFGHRPDRAKNVLDGRATTVVTDLGEINGLIRELSRLVLSFNEVRALATGACSAQPVS